MAGPAFLEFRVNPLSNEQVKKNGQSPLPSKLAAMSTAASTSTFNSRDPRKTPPQIQQLSSPPSTGGKPHPFLLPAPINNNNTSVNTVTNGNGNVMMNSHTGLMYPPPPPPPDWQRILYESNDRLVHLESQLREANAKVAHFKMQHHLYAIEAEDASKRQEVEQIMLRREVEVLSTAVQKSGMPDPSSANAIDQHKALSAAERTPHPARDRALQTENEALRQRLAKVEDYLAIKHSDIVSLQEDNTRLRKRIRDNREHLENLRADARIWSAKEQSRSPSIAAIAHPRHNPAHKKSLSLNTRNVMAHPIGNMQSTDGLSALLLADQVLNAESRLLSASAPSTPITGTRIRPPKARRPYASVQSTPALSQSQENASRLGSIQEGTTPGFENANQAASILASIVAGNGRKRPRSQERSISTTSNSQESRRVNGQERGADGMDDSSQPSSHRNTIMTGSQAAAQASQYLKEDLIQRPLPPPIALPAHAWMPASGPLPSGIFGSSVPGTSTTPTRLNESLPINGQDPSEQSPAKRMKREDGGIGLGLGDVS